MLAGGSAVLSAQKKGGGPAVSSQQDDAKRSKNQQEDVTQITALLTTAMAAPGAAADEQQGEVKIAWESNHFIKGEGGIAYVPFTLSIDRAALTGSNSVVYIRAINRNAPPPAPAAGKAPMYPWSDWNFVSVNSDGKFQRAMMLPGGEYDVFIVAKDAFTGDKKAVAKTGMLRHRITVPDYKAPGLMTSSLFVGDVDQIPAPLNEKQQRENPYTIGTVKIAPAATDKFAKTGELGLFFLVYGAENDPITKRPNVSIEYAFIERAAAGDKPFRKYAPQELNAMTLSPDASAENGLIGGLPFPLANFAPGNYRLEIKITDKAASKSKVENVNFTVN